MKKGTETYDNSSKIKDISSNKPVDILEFSIELEKLRRQHEVKLSKIKASISIEKGFSLDDIINFINNNENGDASLYKILNLGKYLRDNKTLKWYFNNVHYWAEDKDNHHQQHGFDRVILAYLNAITEILEKCDPENVEKNRLISSVVRIRSINNRLFHLQTSTRQLSVLKLVVNGTDGLTIDNEKWNKKLNLLPCKNLLYDLDLHRPVDPEPDDYINFCIPTEYHPKAKCPVFEKMLLSSFDGKQEKVDYFKTHQGYVLRGNCEENLISINYGPNGRNSKSITNKIILACLGPEKVKFFNSPFIKLNKGNSNAEGSTPITSSLEGARFAIINEVNKKDKLDGSRMKQISGGDEIPTRDLFNDARQFEHNATLIINTNARPNIPNDNALWERIKVLLYELSFVNNPDPKKPWERKRDKTLKNRIIENEMSGVLNLILDGNEDYHQFGLIYPDCVIADTLSLREDEDTVFQFIQERCTTTDPNAKTLFINMYEAYLRFCTETKSIHLSKNEFSADMRSKGHRQGHIKNGKESKARFNNKAILTGIFLNVDYR